MASDAALYIDLDRTLIYSRRFAEGRGDAVVVDRDGDRDIAWMTVRALEELRRLRGRMPVVPVTTRNAAEYLRIGLVRELGLDTYAINNGAHVFVDGKPDEDYNAAVRREILSAGLGADEAYRLFTRHTGEVGIKVTRFSDGVLWVIVVDPAVFPFRLADQASAQMEEHGWTVRVSGKKVYLLPRCVTKWRAVQRLMEARNVGAAICAGDSALDLEMVARADCGIVPRGSDLAGLLPGARATASEGIDAAFEILTMAGQLSMGAG